MSQQKIPATPTAGARPVSHPPSVTVSVRCSGSVHQVRLRRGRLQFPAHSLTSLHLSHLLRADVRCATIYYLLSRPATSPPFNTMHPITRLHWRLDPDITNGSIPQGLARAFRTYAPTLRLRLSHHTLEWTDIRRHILIKALRRRYHMAFEHAYACGAFLNIMVSGDYPRPTVSLVTPLITPIAHFSRGNWILVTNHTIPIPSTILTIVQRFFCAPSSSPIADGNEKGAP